MALTRKQIREGLETVPIDQVLLVPGELTHKQKEFARLVAAGETGSGAYRKAYSKTSKPNTAKVEASKLKNHPNIARTIEAFRAANEVAKLQTPQQLRALVINSLVQVLVDPDSNPAQRVQAAKVLGTVTEVAAFTERKEVTHIKTAQDAKGAILERLREVMKASATDAQVIDAESLLSELTATGSETETPAADTHPSPTPHDTHEESQLSKHTIPHPRTPEESNSSTPTPLSKPDSFLTEGFFAQETPPLEGGK